MILQAKLISNVLEGIELVNAPVGKLYLIDLDSKTDLLWISDGKHKLIKCYYEIDGETMIPCDLLEFLI